MASIDRTPIQPRNRGREDQGSDQDDDQDQESIPSPGSGAGTDPDPGLDPDQVEEIKQGIDALRWIPWPADPSVKVCLRPLTRKELYEAAAAAKDYIEDVGLKDTVYEESTMPDGKVVKVYWLDLAHRDELLAIALRNGDDPGKPLFRNANDLRDKMMSTEINTLYDILGEHMLRVMPLTMAQKMGNEEAYLKLLQYLKKEQGAMELISLPHGILVRLLAFTVEKLVN